jgi:peptidoglycan/LPS O-acetylase OafA/YrhL
MKKAIVVFILAALVLATVGLWIFTSSGNFKLVDIASFGIIILVVAFAVFFGYKKLVSAKRGEPAEDELSKKVMRKTSSLSYFISLYLWLVIMYFSDKLEYETHTLIGTGILGMAIIFAVCWLVINFTGIKNE